MAVRRYVIGMTGASGQVYGIRLLQVMAALPEVETHLVLSRAAAITLAQEAGLNPAAIQAMANVSYHSDDLAAAIASGSFATAGMIVAPCSIKTLSAIAHSYTDDLISRAADVHLKEGRPVLLAVRETPLHLGHLELMAQAARLGCIIYPPVPAFYARPQTLADVVDNTVGRMLARIGVENDLYHRWQGIEGEAP